MYFLPHAFGKFIQCNVSDPSQNACKILASQRAFSRKVCYTILLLKKEVKKAHRAHSKKGRLCHMKLSARNQLKGTITEINEGAVNAIVKIDIGGGNVISSTISMASVKELGLAVGKQAYAVIKATSVMVGIDD